MKDFMLNLEKYWIVLQAVWPVILLVWVVGIVVLFLLGSFSLTERDYKNSILYALESWTPLVGMITLVGAIISCFSW